jgi:hypothetical protein
MQGINENILRDIARLGTGVELRVVTGEDGKQHATVQEGSFGGRLVRNLKVLGAGENDRLVQRQEYGLAKVAVFDELAKIYGKDIAEQAFQAGVGRVDQHGYHGTSANYPLNGRHIAKMLQTADELVGRYRQLTNWVDRVTGNPDELGPQRPVVLGDKVSVPRGRVEVTEAFGHIVDDLHNDADRRLDENRQHGFWILHFGLKGRVEGSDIGEIGIHIDAGKPGRVEVMAGDGQILRMSRNELAGWLTDYNREHFGREVGMTALFRAETITLGDNDAPLLPPGLVHDLDRNSMHAEYAEQLASDSQNPDPDGVDDLYSPDEEWEDRNRGGSVDQGPQFERQGERNVAKAQGLIADGKWNEICADNDDRIQREAGRGETNFSPSLASSMKSRDLSLRIEDGDARPLKQDTDVIEQLQSLRTPENQTVFFRTKQFDAFTRFLNDLAFLDTYRNILGQLNPDLRVEEIPDPTDVPITIEPKRDENGDLVLDVTFRARLPDGVKVPTGGGSLDGPDCELAMTLHVPYSEVMENQPKISYGQPVIEMRQ